MPHDDSLPPLTGRPLADLVTDDGRVARVLEQFGLDYCCGGHRTLEEAAANRGVPVDDVADALRALGPPGDSDRLPAEWQDLDVLTRHITAVHHRYVLEAIPVIQAWLEKLVSRHGAAHPELAEVRATFTALGEDLRSHLAKEENILFPAINDLAVARRTGTSPPASPFGTVLHPVRLMEEDHQMAGDLVDRLRRLTGHYRVPEDGCTTYRLCLGELERFEADLHRHVHLENNVLFPRALELEQALV